jgi:methanogenic corrinoid protein MtbC1
MKKVGMTITPEMYNGYFENLTAGRRIKCLDQVTGLLEQGIDLKTLYLDLFRKSLYEIGRLWEIGKISVATEHMATAITEYLMTLAYPMLFSADHIGRSAIVSCVANEFHQIGGKMVADIIEANGWDSFFLGADTPVEHLIDMIQEKKPDILALSFSVFFNMPHLIAAIEQVRKTHDRLPILIGGQAFQWGGQDIAVRYPNVHFLESLPQIEIFLSQFKG